MADPVRVPLPHGQVALIDADDAERILAQRRGLTACSGGEL